MRLSFQHFLWNVDPFFGPPPFFPHGRKVFIFLQHWLLKGCLLCRNGFFHFSTIFSPTTVYCEKNPLLPCGGEKNWRDSYEILLRKSASVRRGLRYFPGSSRQELHPRYGGHSHRGRKRAAPNRLQLRDRHTGSSPQRDYPDRLPGPARTAVRRDCTQPPRRYGGGLLSRVHRPYPVRPQQVQDPGHRRGGVP